MKSTRYEYWRKKFHKPGHLHIHKWKKDTLKKYLHRMQKHLNFGDEHISVALDSQSFYVNLNSPSKKMRMKYNIPHHWIVIGDHSDEYVQVADLFHEIGHYNCSISRCFCADKNVTYSEYHAIKFSLDHLKRFELSDSLVYEMRTLARHADYARNGTLSVYNMAARYLMRTKLWQQYKAASATKRCGK